jgi:thiosulfate reductase cytochrome b subunit
MNSPSWSEKFDHGSANVYRHSPIVRVTHWLNALCVFALLISGLGITQLYTPLHWGDAGQEWGDVGQEINGNSGDPYPVIATVPEISSRPATTYLRTAMRVRDHIAFAWLFLFNGLVYLGAGILTGRFQGILRPSLSELSWSKLGRELRNHVRLRFPQGDAARSYNLLQKYAYLFVIFGALPLQLLTGLALLPWMDGAAPWLKDLFGGRQSARTIHFFCALSVLAFVVVHVAMVVLSGFRNNMRSMITGRYELPR